MPIKNDLSSLPPALRRDGMLPVEKPIVVSLLAQRWFEQYVADGQVDRAKAMPERRFRASWASKRCDRSLQYALTNVEASDPSTLADYWRFGMGTLVHDALEDVIHNLFPDALCEVPIDLKPIGLDGSATVDIVLPATDNRRAIVIEVKTINGFGFKKAATSFKGPAEGPRWGAIVQGALAAAVFDADLIIAYLSLESMSPSLAISYGDGSDVGRFAAEWHIDAEQAKAIATAEVQRINRVLALTDAEIVAPREIHDRELQPGATVTDPKRGMWTVEDNGKVVSTGTTWMCDYCDHRAKCIEDGAGGASSSSEF